MSKVLFKMCHCMNILLICLVKIRWRNQSLNIKDKMISVASKFKVVCLQVIVHKNSS